MVKKGLEKFGKIDILENNAGASSELNNFTKVRQRTLLGLTHGLRLLPADHYGFHERRLQ
jgi:NAD(P)-dependent dehydrogenase (short-subunit alcohol dehydrogenase family)